LFYVYGNKGILNALNPKIKQKKKREAKKAASRASLTKKGALLRHLFSTSKLFT
jgi:hypothetical protein